MAYKAHDLSSDKIPATTNAPEQLGGNETLPDSSEPILSASSKPIEAPVFDNAEHRKNDLFRDFAFVWLAVNFIDGALFPVAGGDEYVFDVTYEMGAGDADSVVVSIEVDC